MNTIEIIAKLAHMLDDAIELIVDQHKIMAMHGIADLSPELPTSITARREKILREREELMNK